MPEPTEETQRIPPRYRWTRRIARMLLITLALLILIRLAWGWEANRRLNAAIRELRGPGRPLLAEDFKKPDLPDDQNAAALLIQAARGVKWIENNNHLSRLADGTATHKDMEVIRNWVRQNEPSLALVRSARGLGVNWNTALEQPASRYPQVNHLGVLRSLGDVLDHTARAAYHDGNHSLAIEYLRDLRCLAAVLYARPYTSSGAMAVGIDLITADNLPQMGQKLLISSDAAARSNSNHPITAASTERVRLLIAELLDESSAREGKLLGIHGDRLLALDYYRGLKAGEVGWQISLQTMDWLQLTLLERRIVNAIAPALDLKAERILRHLNQVALALEAENYQAVAARMPRRRLPPESPAYLVDRFVQFDIIPEHIFTARNHFLARAARRATAISLAVRLYRHDHGEQWPRAVTDLVPHYLPAAPSDPFAADGRAMRYLPPPRAFVYSVNHNGVDDLAARRWTLPPRAPVKLAYLHDPDLVFELGP